MKKLIIVFIHLLFSSLSFAQVKDLKYEVMLNKLLSHTVDKVNVKEAINKENALLLDTREKNEYKVSHIKGAKWVGYETFSMKRLKGVSKNTEIILYCSVGYRSEKIGEKLKENGYKKVFNLYGGIFEWVNNGNTVVNNKEEKTPKVHGFDKDWSVWLKKGMKIF